MSLASPRDNVSSVNQERPLDLSVPRSVLQTGTSSAAAGCPPLSEIRIVITVVACSCVRATVDSDTDSSSDESDEE